MEHDIGLGEATHSWFSTDACQEPFGYSVYLNGSRVIAAKQNGVAANDGRSATAIRACLLPSSNGQDVGNELESH